MADDGKLIDLTATAGPRKQAATGGDRLERGQALGRYLILELLGQGGMGMVYAAYDPDLDRKVALKLLRRSGPAVSRSARSRLLREARAMAKLHHPNVITVYEVGTVGDEDFVAMQYVDGSNLSEWLAQGPTRATRDQVVASFIEAGRGLAAAHRAGLIHRDFKPTNVLVDTEGRVRVTDFGLVQRAGGEPEATADAGDGDAPLDGLTRTGATLGTPAYMAPEQYLGGETDERTDQFSFCVALYEALYGERPFAGDDYDELRESVTSGTVRGEPEGADVPARLRRVLLRGLSLERDDRYPSMDALLADLGKNPAAARRRWALGIAAALIALAAIAVLRGDAGDAAMCADSEQELRGVWDDGVERGVREAFRRARVSDELAERAFSGFSEALDGYADAWTAMHAESCRATYVDKTQSEDDYALRLACLREKRDELGKLAAVFTRADDEAVERAAQAARGISPLRECEDIESLRAGFEPPDDDDEAAVAELRSAMSEIKALDDAGQKGRALELAQRSLATAREIGYLPMLAEALYWSGRVHMELGHSTEARAALDEAILVAEEAGHLRVRAEALVLRTGLTASFTSRVDDARLWARRAAAAIKSVGGDPQLRAKLDEYEALIAAQEQQYDEALALLERARARYHTLGDATKEANALRKRAETHMMRRRFRDALEDYREALVIYENELGRDHPRVALTMEGFARNLRAVGSLDAAREYFARAEKVWSTERGQAWLDDHELPGTVAGERVIRGRVTDAKGQPVASAEVVIGQHIVADSQYLYSSSGGQHDRKIGRRHVMTGEDGTFEIDGACSCELLIAAEHWKSGRSRAKVIPAGEDPHTVGIVLGPTGRVRGRALVAGKLAPWRFVLLARRPTETARNQVVAIVGEDGSYAASGLPPGTWETMLLDEGSEPGQRDVLTQGTVQIVAGEEVTLDFDVPAGTIDLKVSVRGDKGARIPSAQVLLATGIIKADSAAELNKKLLKAAATGRLKIAFVARGQTHSFEHLEPGLYSVCTLPLAGDFRDPDFMAKLAPHVLDLKVYCDTVNVVSGDEQQQHTAVVPPMPPLEDD